MCDIWQAAQGAIPHTGVGCSSCASGRPVGLEEERLAWLAMCPPGGSPCAVALISALAYDTCATKRLCLRCWLWARPWYCLCCMGQFTSVKASLHQAMVMNPSYRDGDGKDSTMPSRLI